MNVPHEDPDFLLNVRETAKRLKISERKLSDLVKAGVIPSLKLGARRLFSPQAVRAWIQNQTTDQQGAA